MLKLPRPSVERIDVTNPTGPDLAALPSIDTIPDEAQRKGLLQRAFFALCVLYAAWHLYTLNIAPLETWTFRILHVAGALTLGFALSAAVAGDVQRSSRFALAFGIVALAVTLWAGVCLAVMATAAEPGGPAWASSQFGWVLGAGGILAVVAGWLGGTQSGRISLWDWAAIAASLIASGFILMSLDALSLRLRAGTPFADPNNAWAAFVLVLLILELTRRVAGLALVVIALVFLGYSFLGPWLPGFLEHRGYDAKRFFSYIYTDNGILGPTTAVSSTYIILFIIFAAFLQTSKVGDYFVNFAFAVAGRARGGPAKVSVFASGLMGMINGTSAGNVVSTGSLTIPLMKKV
ncbi:MAG: TRAP transporter large permease subunit, partial [Pseudomonadota bacterium]